MLLYKPNAVLDRYKKSVTFFLSVNPLSHWIIFNLSKYTLDHQTAGQSFRWPIVPLYYIEDCQISKNNWDQQMIDLEKPPWGPLNLESNRFNGKKNPQHTWHTPMILIYSVPSSEIFDTAFWPSTLFVAITHDPLEVARIFGTPMKFTMVMFHS